jgi:hypothetical protein
MTEPAGNSSTGAARLDGPEQQRFLKREWLAERIGWGLMFGVLVSASVGLLGTGPLSTARKDSASGRLAIKYDRIVRSDAPNELEIEITPLPGTGSITLSWPREFVSSVQFQSLQPNPTATTGHEDRVEWTFNRPASGQALQIDVTYEFHSPGMHTFELRSEAEHVTWRQVVLP